MTRDPGFLDPFVLDHRREGSEDTYRRLMAAQEVYALQFMREQAVEFMARTRKPRPAV
jgi:hypothetical protein